MWCNSLCKQARVYAPVLAKRTSVRHPQPADVLAYKHVLYSLEEMLCLVLWLLSQNVCDCAGAR